MSKSTDLGVYIHIPYCLQRCTYCDFATYVHTEIPPPQDYIKLVTQEIQLRSKFFKPQTLHSLYFGGGTPSLIPAEFIVELIQALSKLGYTTGPRTEVTLEINPATVDEKKLDVYLKNGVNRFSVGAQTFSDRLLKMVNREHNSKQTLETLELLNQRNLNFSFDLLFALPTQTLQELDYDLEVALQLGSKHISPYCLTVPEGHPLSKNRPLEEDQVEMFRRIHETLLAKGYLRYEISNYALPGFESRHNNLYWQDKNYWGLGLSAHSYNKNAGLWGQRFWNPNSYKVYQEQILSNLTALPSSQMEHLEEHQSLTDFCHTSLRLTSGLSTKKLADKFSKKAVNIIDALALPLLQKNLLVNQNDSYILTDPGILISNQIFEKFTFTKDDLRIDN